MLFVAIGVYGSWLSAAKGTASLLCPFVVLGLLFGLLGDIWLDLKYVFPEKDEPFTYAGFCVFGVGHILYIIGMVLLSGSLVLAHGWKETPLNLLFIGGVFFAISDLILSGTYFGVGKERPIDLALNYITYYTAQFLIASALVFLT